MKYDIIIIGTGAGGGTMAARLAPTGKNILILERGGYVPREKENWDTKEVFVKGKVYCQGTLDRCPWEKNSTRAFTTMLEETPNFMVQRYCACVKKTLER